MDQDLKVNIYRYRYTLLVVLQNVVFLFSLAMEIFITSTYLSHDTKEIVSETGHKGQHILE